MIEQRFVERIASELGVRADQVAAAVQLFDKGATVPFVARYRKDVTDHLRDETLELIEERNVYYTALINRRDAILQNIDKQGRLSEDLRAALENAFDEHALEDFYLPFRRQRRSQATIAREQGLFPLAEFLWRQADEEETLESVSASFAGKAPGIATPEAALAGARAILVERVAFTRDARAAVRERFWQEGKLLAQPTKSAEGKKTKFETYYNFSEPLATIPSHRLLAVLRGVKLGYLQMTLSIDDAGMLAELVKSFISNAESPTGQQMRLVVEEAYWRLLRPTLESDVLALARRRAEDEAIAVFRANARSLLLSPPAGRIPVIGVEPDQKGGAVLAAVDASGKFLESTHIYPLSPTSDADGARQALLALVDKYSIQAVAIGNGEGARDIARFLNGIIRQELHGKVFSVYVNEAGAAIYSASKLAREELPDLEMSTRSAVTIARRLQDPLSELVKVEPRNIGVGQYQHDVNQRRLRDGLYKTIVSCVNAVGVELNSASLSLLRYVSGIQMGTAQNILAFRDKEGGFKSREQLLSVDGIGPKTFEQCAGFMRIAEGTNALDRTAIHPEAYAVVRNIGRSLGLAGEDLVGNREAVGKINFEAFRADVVGAHTLHDIRAELMKPARDPRRPFRVPRFIEGVHSVEDLKEGMETEGVVTNVTNFGAFVDIGVHQDGLVHLSELANRFVHDPRQVVKVGDVVRVKIIGVDKQQPRISLSMKAVTPLPEKASRRPRRKKRRPATDQAAAPAPAPAAEPARAEEPRRPRSERPRDRDEEARRRSRGASEGGAQGENQQPQQRPRRPRQEDRARASERGTPTSVKYRPANEDKLNTQLADQLAQLRRRLDE
ncbi:MAG: RNA-binding transcriptional accessory protein [Candidatus Hydrogenedentes bacterium]|nr:RNA-binding transcriptional accessory protein [Candidatus Hydrogenedentota bacterium]